MAIQFDNSNTGVVTLKPGASGSYSLVLPTALPGVAGYVLASDLSGNLSWAVNGSGGSMVYPGAGIPNSTGSAWGTSYTTTGSGTVVALQTQPSFTTDIRTPKVTTASAVNLTIDTNAGTTTGSIVINTGANGAIALTTNGTGAVQLVASTTQLGVSNTAATLTTNGTANLTLSTNNGTNSGTILINNGANGNIAISPNGAGTTTFSTGILVAGNANVSGTLSVTSASTLYGTTTVANGSSNYFTLTGAASGTGPTLASAGATDTNVNFTVQTKGTGSFVVSSTTTNTTSNITASGANANINLVLAGKGTGTVVANTLVITTSGTVTTGTWNATTIATGYGGTGLTSFTNNGAVYANSTSTLTTGTLPVASGGTGQTTYTDGQLLIGNTTGNTLTKATLTQGSGITITNGNGSISIANASPMTYPGSGIPNSTGSAWGTSYSTTGSSTVVALGTSPSFTTDIRTPKVTTASAVNLVLDTNAGTTTGSITIATGANGNITLAPNGTGIVILGDNTSAGTVTTGGAASNLTLSTNSGTNSGTIVITAGANNAISLTPNGVGVINANGTGALKLPVGTDAQQPGQVSQATAAQGMIRYNTTQSRFEGYNGSAWAGIGGQPGGVNTNVQFNNSNVLGGSNNFTWNNSTNTLTIAGTFNATTKSFYIDHPTKKGMKLVYGSLEGPEHGVYVRGRLTASRIIELPDYWMGLVDADTITVNLTPVGKYQKLYVDKIEGNKVYIDNDSMFGGNVDCFYTVWATRKDVATLDVEVNA